MEALGIASGILNALSATADLAHFVQSIRNAPIELIALSNEVTDLKLVISEVEALDRDCNLVRKSSESLTKILLSARITLDQFALFIDDSIRPREDGKTLASRCAAQRFKWAFSQKKTAKRLQRELRGIRLNIGILLAAQSSADSHSVHLILSRASEQNEYSRPSATLLTAANIADGQSLGSTTSTNFAISLHKRHHSACLSNCTCKCHGKACRQTHTFMSDIFGKLLIGYSGTLAAVSECSNTCRKDGVYSAQVTYVFPLWFVASAISVFVWRKQRSLTVSLAVRKFTEDWKLFHYIESGDLPSVKSLVHRKRESPNDLEITYGRTALHWTVQLGQVEICRFLLQAGADPSRTVIDQVTERVLGGSPCLTPASRDELKTLFWKEDDLESLELPILHQIVLGLHPGNVVEELMRHDTDVDAQDRLGYTATAWAGTAQVNNNDALRVLLQYRADPNICDLGQLSPLDHAIMSKEPSSMKILLEHGMRSVPRSSGWTALHAAVSIHNDLSFIIPLINSGCKTDVQYKSGHTPLSIAASAGNDIVALYLIEHGANINSMDNWANTPLMRAVQCGSANVLIILLGRGADYNTVNRRGHTIIHDAVDFHNVKIETLKVLKNARLRGIDTQARNSAGLTAMELIQQRNDVSDEFRSTFEALLESIEPIEPVAPIELSYIAHFERGPWGFNTTVAFLVLLYIMTSLGLNEYWSGLLSCFAGCILF